MPRRIDGNVHVQETGHLYLVAGGYSTALVLINRLERSTILIDIFHGNEYENENGTKTID